LSSFLGDTPTLRLSVKNHLLGLSYPSSGTAVGVVDTGYDGFLAVSDEIFSALGLDKLPSSSRTVLTADGRPLSLASSFASVLPLGLGQALDGPVEAGPGIGEILVGTRLLRRFNLGLDYCARVFKIERCR
jgi:clan AA aspartic protease